MSGGYARWKNPGAIIGAIVGIGIVLAAFGFVFYLMQGSYEKPTYSLAEGSLMISGQFGVTINLEGAAAVREPSLVPATETRTNGAAIGNIRKGYFKMAGEGVYLSVMDATSPGYILITARDGSKYYINCASPEETDGLYQKIAEQMGLAD